MDASQVHFHWAMMGTPVLVLDRGVIFLNVAIQYRELRVLPTSQLILKSYEFSSFYNSWLGPLTFMFMTTFFSGPYFGLNHSNNFLTGCSGPQHLPLTFHHLCKSCFSKMQIKCYVLFASDIPSLINFKVLSTHQIISVRPWLLLLCHSLLSLTFHAMFCHN